MSDRLFLARAELLVPFFSRDQKAAVLEADHYASHWHELYGWDRVNPCFPVCNSLSVPRHLLDKAPLCGLRFANTRAVMLEHAGTVLEYMRRMSDAEGE